MRMIAIDDRIENQFTIDQLVYGRKQKIKDRVLSIELNTYFHLRIQDSIFHSSSGKCW